MRTYNGRQLVEKYGDMNVEGTWQVVAEDPNCDFNGPHHQPYLFTAEGKLFDVVLEAVNYSGFWQWGYGGDITRIDIVKADPKSRQAREAAQKRLAVLKAEVVVIEKQLEQLL
jgi:hypothetical protein